MDFQEKETYSIDDLRKIMVILRSENGCPWDREQDHHSIRRDFLEEVYEAVEAIDLEDPVLMQEELGDVLLQVVFHARLEEEQGSFNLDDVITGICKKLIYRHPHVFGDVKADNTAEVLKNWDALKKVEKSQKTCTETLTSVPKVFPALMRSDKVLSRAKKANVNCPVLPETAEEASENLTKAEDVLREAVSSGDASRVEEATGEMLFELAKLSRFFKTDCEKSLTNATEKFINRFSNTEELALKQGIRLENADQKTWNDLWQQTAD